jgi:hypothetical protein
MRAQHVQRIAPADMESEEEMLRTQRPAAAAG